MAKLPKGLYQRGSIFWTKVYQHGRPIYQSTGTSNLTEAKRILDVRRGAAQRGESVLPQVDRVRWEEAQADLIAYYEATGKRDVAEAQSRVAHLGLYFAGWRIARIDTPAEPGTTKNKEGRTFYLTPELRACLEAQRATTEALQRQTGRIISSVFHREGTPMKSFWKAWKTACKAAGAPGRLPHVFRRTAVSNLERAGVPRSVAMKMVGHKTEAIYRRYAIVSAADLQDAAKKLAAVSASGDNLVTVAPARP